MGGSVLRRSMPVNVPLLGQAQLFFSELQAHHTHDPERELEPKVWAGDMMARKCAAK